MTGTIDEYDEEEIEEEIQYLDGKYEKILSNKTTMLIVGQNANHSVIDAALEKGIVVVTDKFCLGLIGLGDADDYHGNDDSESESDIVAMPKAARIPIQAQEIIEI